MYFYIYKQLAADPVGKRPATITSAKKNIKT